jgi:hypothetical protein
MLRLHDVLTSFTAVDEGAHADAVLDMLPALAQLIQGKPLGEEFWTDEKKRTATYVWRPVQVRGVNVGDTVRIKHDAFTGKEAALNGKTGKVTAIRNGIIVMYDDVADKSTSTSLGFRHTLDELEVQIAIPRRVTQ